MFFLNPATFLRLLLLMFPYSTCELHWLSSISKYFFFKFQKAKTALVSNLSQFPISKEAKTVFVHSFVVLFGGFFWFVMTRHLSIQESNVSSLNLESGQVWGNLNEKLQLKKILTSILNQFFQHYVRVI